LLLFLPSLAFAGENCNMMGGVCRDRCANNEEELDGAFIDCGEKQQCCTAKAESSGSSKTADKEEPEPRDKGAR